MKLLLAQTTPIDTSSMGAIGDFAGKFGFPALLVLVLLYGIYLMQQRADKKQDTRDQQDIDREKARREEREADRAAHIQALAQNTSALSGLGEKMDALLSRTEQNIVRLVKG